MGKKKYSGEEILKFDFFSVSGWYLIKPQQSCEVNTTIVPILYKEKTKA